MRLTWILSLLLFAFTTVAVAQNDKDTNFANGPQYLITNGSSIFLHPISTPSLSLSYGPQDPYIDATDLAPALPPPDQTFLGSVYWGDHPDSQIVGRRLSPPNMTPSETAWYMDEVTREVGNNLSPISVTPAEESAGPGYVEITSTQLPANLPASLLDVGVTGAEDGMFFREPGSRVPLGDVAAYWKSHKGRAPHTYTNSDINRLHGG